MSKKEYRHDDDFFNQQEESCCDSVKLIEENGYIVCLNCGCVYYQIFDDSPRRAFTQEEVRKRKKNEPVYSPIGPRTVIKGQRDARGMLLSPKHKSQFNRLAKIHRSLTTSFERNLWIALPNLQRLQKVLGIPDTVAEDALRIYTYTVKEKLTMGRSIDTLLTASIFAALRVHGIPRTIDEIVNIANLPKKKVVKSYRLIFMEVLPKLQLKVQYFDPERYVDKFVEDLHLPMKVRNYAIELIETAKKNGFIIAGKDPKGISCAAIYLGAKKYNEPRTQKEISDLSNITEVTLRMRCKDLIKYSFPVANSKSS